MQKWLLDPPCEAELFLEKLFKENCVTAEDTAAKVQKRYKIFEPFSSAVFRNNFKRYRSLEGIALRNNNRENDEYDELVGPIKRSKEENEVQQKSSFIEHICEPILQATYKKIGTLDEFVIVLLPMISGITNIRFNLSEDGMEGIVKFQWPKPMYDLSRIFSDELKSMESLKVVALEEELVKVRNSKFAVPEGLIKIKLPFPVEPNGHIIKGVENDNCQLLYIELPAYKKVYSKTETAITFNK